MRLDRFLWWARIAKSRDTAQAMACDGHFRMDGRAIDRAHAPVRIGSILTFAHHGQVRVLRVESLPRPARTARRGARLLLRSGHFPGFKPCYGFWR
jgi:ribosomal 50S subunit-recycling heat shock protein